MEGEGAAAQPQKTSGWVKFGGIATALYVAFIVFVLLDSGAEGFLHITSKDLSLNTFGDFLAGVCAPLAFLWLFIATMVQSQELALQREELRLTREEFRQNREVAKQQAEEARSQAAFIGMQTAILQAAEIDKLIDIQMQSVVRRVNDLRGRAITIGGGSNRTEIYLLSPFQSPSTTFVESAKAMIDASEEFQRVRTQLPDLRAQFERMQDLQAIHQLLCVIDANVANASQKTAATLKNSDFSDALRASEYLLTECGG